MNDADEGLKKFNMRIADLVQKWDAADRCLDIAQSLHHLNAEVLFRQMKEEARVELAALAKISNPNN